MLDVLEKTESQNRPSPEERRGASGERSLIDAEISAACQRLGVSKANIRKYYTDSFNCPISRDLDKGKSRQIASWLRTVEKPKPRVVLTPHIQDAASRTGLSSRAVLHRVYKHFLVTSLKDLTYEQKLDALEWLSVMGRENQPSRHPQTLPTAPDTQASTVRLELVVSLDKAHRILAIAGE